MPPRSRSCLRASVVAAAALLQLWLASDAVGVGKIPEDPNPVPSMWRFNVGRSEHAPLCIVPERGQITKDGSKSAKSKGWGVFHEHEARSYTANDSRHFSPQSRSLAVNPGTLSGRANVLTGEPPRNHVNPSAPRSRVKCSHVVPDWERLKAPVILARAKYRARVWVKLDSANRAPSEKPAAEDAAASARE